MVVVYSQSVMVIRMIVIGVRVYVQRRDWVGSRGQNHTEQDRDRATHDPSVCNPVRRVKLTSEGRRDFVASRVGE